jgi:putative ABC transport system permease protein
MIRFFGIPIDNLTTILLVVTGCIIGGVLLLALTNRIFFKIGVRNIGRRRVQMGLIIFALMLSTTLLSSVLATGDVLTSTVQSVAVYNWANIDETIEGGRGPLGTFSQRIYNRVQTYAHTSKTIAAVGADLRESNLLVADESSRQVHSNVTALAVLPGSEQGFGGMLDVNTKQQLSIESLGTNDVYLNLTTAQLLNAHIGDTLYLYSSSWPGRRYAMRVAAIVGNAGLVGDNAYMLARLDTFQNIEESPGMINEIVIANRGGGGLNGVGLSEQVSKELNAILPPSVHVNQVKQQGIHTSQVAQNIFSHVFSLFSLFALAIGLLLIFLIFVLLAAERRSEMGMARAIGVQRHHLVLMYIFEGAVYDFLSSLVGIVIGMGSSILLLNFLQPMLQRFNFPLKFSFQPHSLIVAYCLGVIFTFCSVAISSWLVSRMTIVQSMHDLPEIGYVALSFAEIKRLFLQYPRKERRNGEKAPLFTTANMRLHQARRFLFEHVPNVGLELLRTLAVLGFTPLLVGLGLIQWGLARTQIIPFSLGVSLTVLGCGLLLNALLSKLITFFSEFKQVKQARTTLQRVSSSNSGQAQESGASPAPTFPTATRASKHAPGTFQRVSSSLLVTLVGCAIVAYWALPFDVLAKLGLPRFAGGIEVFFVAGIMMVFCTACVLLANARLWLAPLLALCARLPSLYILAKLSSAYPLHGRFRTWLNMVMFSLVVFAMTVMAIITNAMQNTYVDINTQTGGYDIRATAYFRPLPDLHTSLQQYGINPAAFTTIGKSDTTTVGVIQPSAQQARWGYYPAQIVNGGFLQGYGLHLSARANDFSSDAAIWQALQTHPDYALLDSSAVPYNPNALANPGVYDPSAPPANQAGGPATPPDFNPATTFELGGVFQGEDVFPATPVWIADTSNSQSLRVTIIGIVDNSDSAHFGLYLSQDLYDNAGWTKPLDSGNPHQESYYFKVAPGQDKHALSLALGSAFLDYGLETIVLEDLIWQVRGPRIFLSQVLLGVVGITLLLGVAGLAITGTRAVIERRQQIGMLRALGCSRLLVRGSFLLESFLIGALGSTLGVVLGLILARNIFAANFFERYRTGLEFSIPWQQLEIIIAVSLLASLLGALLPAWQAGRVTPAEALRYV